MLQIMSFQTSENVKKGNSLSQYNYQEEFPICSKFLVLNSSVEVHSLSWFTGNF